MEHRDEPEFARSFMRRTLEIIKTYDGHAFTSAEMEKILADIP